MMAESSGSKTAAEEAARQKQQVKETEQVEPKAGDTPAPAEAPKAVPIEEHDQNLPGSYSEEGGISRPYGMTADEVAQKDAEAARKDAEKAAKEEAKNK
jgi:hypothetical protein